MDAASERTSAPVTKSVTSLWSKTLAYFPKGPGAANAVARIVVAHAQNIDGSPFAGEVVCFAADVRVLIVGQDPYPTPGHPVGLSFSVAPDVRPVPRSLRSTPPDVMAPP